MAAAAAADMSSTKRYVSKLPHDNPEDGGGLRPGTSTLKDIFFPPRKPRSDLPAHPADLSPRGEKAAMSSSGKKSSAIAMERCLRVQLPQGKGPLFTSQKQEEIRDGVLHLKPQFHLRNDTLFVEFPTPEKAKQAQDTLASYSVAGISPTFELQNILGSRGGVHRHTLDEETQMKIDHNAAIMRNFYEKDKKWNGGGTCPRSGTKTDHAYNKKIAERPKQMGTSTSNTRHANSYDMYDISSSDPFGLETPAGERVSSRASSDDMQPRSASAMGLKPAGMNADFFPPRHSGPTNYPPVNRDVSLAPSLLGKAPGNVDYPQGKSMLDLVHQSLEELREEKMMLDRKRQQIDFEWQKFRQETQAERAKLKSEWHRFNGEKNKLLDSLKRVIAEAQKSPATISPAKTTDGQITCHDVRLMDKSAMPVWSEKLDLKSEGKGPLIDLSGGKEEDIDDTKSVLVPVLTEGVRADMRKLAEGVVNGDSGDDWKKNTDALGNHDSSNNHDGSSGLDGSSNHDSNNNHITVEKAVPDSDPDMNESVEDQTDQTDGQVSSDFLSDSGEQAFERVIEELEQYSVGDDDSDKWV